jgi:hypothetical protein
MAKYVAQRLPPGPVHVIAESFSGPLAILLAREHHAVKRIPAKAARQIQYARPSCRIEDVDASHLNRDVGSDWTLKFGSLG